MVEFTNQFVKKIRCRLKRTPISAKQQDNGNIKLVHYTSNNLITPLVKDIHSTERAGSTCVLTKTNEEAMQVAGLLLKNGLQAKLIQSNDGFNLYNFLEIRFFVDELKLEDDVFIINDEIWENAKREFLKRFKRSSRMEVCENIIKDFEVTNPKKKYKSDLDVFIRESKLEDFFGENGEILFVSTMHKAKGREFDNVYLLLDNFQPQTDDAKRQLYVAMTRAKQNLTIHLNGNYLDNITADNLVRTEDKKTYLPPNQIAMHLSFKDVWLDYFMNRQHLIGEFISGDALKVNGEGCTNVNGESVLKFSKQFLATLADVQRKGYRLKEAKVNFIVYWKKQDQEQEIKIILSELYFER